MAELERGMMYIMFALEEEGSKDGGKVLRNVEDRGTDAMELLEEEERARGSVIIPVLSSRVDKPSIGDEDEGGDAEANSRSIPPGQKNSLSLSVEDSTTTKSFNRSRMSK
jgi:hypothetical protein